MCEALQYTKAYQEQTRIATLSAFNINGAVSKRKCNQHLCIYKFDDESKLYIYSSSSHAAAQDKYGNTRGIKQS